MNRRLFTVTFAGEEDLLEATRAAREQGLNIIDVYTPYAVHGLDKALGLRPSRLSRVCLVCGILGAFFAMWFQYWSTAVDWPINVGGRPWNSWPAFIPVTFELMVLFAGLGVVFAFFVVSKLFPGKRAVLPAPGITSNRFLLVLEENSAAFDGGAVRRLFQDFHALEMEEREQDSMPASGRAFLTGRPLNIFLFIIFLTVVALNWLIRPDHGRPNLEFLPDMVESVPYDSFAPNPNFPDKMTLQKPPAGTIARGQTPFHYRPTPEDAIRAGKEVPNPFSSDDAKARKRGQWVFTQYCAVCHGLEGKGDGPVTQRGVPPPPPLLAEKALTMKDGQMFHILTHGQGNMASYAGQLLSADRWQVILHIRSLQQQAKGKGKL